MYAMQERASGTTVFVNLVNLMVNHGDTRLGPRLKISRLDQKSRIDDRDRDEFMMSNLNTRKALGNGSGRQRRSTDSDDSEEAAGGILHRLLHVLAEMTHLGRLSV
jgi:hypothetical protein